MCKHHRNPVHCILPPYMTDKLTDMLAGENESFNEGFTEVAGTSDNAFRNKRKLLASMPPVKRSFKMAAAAPETKLYREVYDANESPMSV